MSASESGVTITQSTGDPRPEGCTAGKKGAARRGSALVRCVRGGSWPRAVDAAKAVRPTARRITSARTGLTQREKKGE